MSLSPTVVYKLPLIATLAQVILQPKHKNKHGGEIFLSKTVPLLHQLKCITLPYQPAILSALLSRKQFLVPLIAIHLLLTAFSYSYKIAVLLTVISIYHRSYPYSKLKAICLPERCYSMIEIMLRTCRGALQAVLVLVPSLILPCCVSSSEVTLLVTERLE